MKNFDLIEMPSVKIEVMPNKSRSTCHTLGGNYKNWGDGNINSSDSHKYDYKKITKSTVTVYGLGKTIPENFCYTTFTNDMVKSITINNTITRIGAKAFSNCVKLENIYYDGTTEEWRKVLKSILWKENVPATVIHCIDGDVSL